MKILIAFLALVAVALAVPGGHGGGHGDHATHVTHGHPVHTKHFDAPGLGFFNNHAPHISGHHDVRGVGPHIKHGGHH